jgi:Protein of unknown function (DUF1493)
MPVTQQDQIVEFTALQTGVRRAKVTLSTRLLQDLRMDGDDAVDFFESFGETFNVDLERLWLHWPHYFGPEGLFQGLPFRGLELEITVQDLIDSAQAGRWLNAHRGDPI